jgi:hypothetical protein
MLKETLATNTYTKRIEMAGSYANAIVFRAILLRALPNVASPIPTKVGALPNGDTRLP